MPSPLHHNRTFSWPLSFHHLTSNTVVIADDGNIPDIDEDPYSHFISPVTEEDNPYDVLSFGAGIDNIEDNRTSSKVAKFSRCLANKWTSYVARNHPQLHELYHQVEYYQPSPAERPSYKVEFRQPSWILDQDNSEPTRGRAQELLASRRELRRRGRRLSRTLSGHRHSWREPSVDLFTVMEEGDASTGDGIEDGVSGGPKAEGPVERARL